jgi:hypothetical protein
MGGFMTPWSLYTQRAMHTVPDAACHPHPPSVATNPTFPANTAADGGAYYCLEDYKPIGSLLRNVRVAAEARTTPRTGGQVARACAAACNAAPECSGFRAVGPEVKGGSTCQLLANSTQSLPTALAFAGPSTPWPKVNANLTAVDRIALRSISWMCWRQQQDWDRFGAATHNMIVSGDTEGGRQ